MAMDANYKTMNTSYKKAFGNDQQMVECKLYPKSGTIIGKILCAKVVSYSASAEILNGEVRYTGKVRFEVIYSSKDSEVYNINDIVTVEGVIKDDNFKTGMYPMTDTQIIDHKILNVNEDVITMSSICDTKIDAIVSDEVEYLAEVSETLVAKHDIVNYCILKNAQKGKYKVVEEMEVKEDMGKLLMATVNHCINEIYPGTGYITIKGNLNVNLTYQTNGEDKEIKSTMKTIPYKEEIEVEGTTPECIVNMLTDVRYDEVDVFGNNIDGNTVLKMSIPIYYNCVVMHPESTDVVSDAFSTEGYINLVAESFYKSKFNVGKFHKEMVNSSMNLEEDIEVESIAADCGGGAFVANSYCADGFIMVEGVCQSNVIYYQMGEDEQLMYDSMLVDIPFSMEIPCEEATENSESCVSVAVKDMNIKNRRAKDLEVDMELCCYMDVWENEQDMVVSKVEMHEADDEDMPALRMYVARKDSTMWDVCKRTLMDPEALMQQNKDLEFPLKEDEVIVIYKPREEQYQ
jgi:hypothetical protein